MLPERVIIDTANMLRDLNRLAATENFEHPECFASYMVEELMERMRHMSDALDNVRKFSLGICHGEHTYGYDKIPPCFALPILDLGNHIFLQLAYHSLYRIDGVLLYYYQPIADNDFAGIVLRRIHELSYYHRNSNQHGERLGR